MKFLIIYILVQISFLRDGVLDSACFVFNFSLPANHGGDIFFSSPPLPPSLLHKKFLWSCIRKRTNSKHITYFSSLLLEKLSSSIAMPQTTNVKKSTFTSSSPPPERIPKLTVKLFSDSRKETISSDKIFSQLLSNITKY